MSTGGNGRAVACAARGVVDLTEGEVGREHRRAGKGNDAEASAMRSMRRSSVLLVGPIGHLVASGSSCGAISTYHSIWEAEVKTGTLTAMRLVCNNCPALSSLH